MTQRMQQVWTGFYIRSGPMSFPTASSETLTRFQKSIILSYPKIVLEDYLIIVPLEFKLGSIVRLRFDDQHFKTSLFNFKFKKLSLISKLNDWAMYELWLTNLSHTCIYNILKLLYFWKLILNYNIFKFKIYFYFFCIKGVLPTYCMNYEYINEKMFIYTQIPKAINFKCFVSKMFIIEFSCHLQDDHQPSKLNHYIM
jgi:hypothetical protein